MGWTGMDGDGRGRAGTGGDGRGRVGMSGDEEDGCGMIGWMKDVHGHDAHTARPCIYIPAASLAIILDIMTFWEI